MVSTFFASFAFFGAIIFLPRWFQFVQGFTPTNSGLAALPLMVGLIVSSIVSGLIVARTGRYKWLIVGAIVLMGVATALMTQLTADTPVPIVWLWMFIAGLGVGPTFAVFTIVVQNAVPFNVLGVATSNLTFFRQIGGTVALAIVGTIFATDFHEQLGAADDRRGRAAAGRGRLRPGDRSSRRARLQPPDRASATSARRSWPLSSRGPAVIAPFIAQIVAGIHAAFSLGVAQTFWIGVVGQRSSRRRGAVHEGALRSGPRTPGRGARDRTGNEPAHGPPGQRTRRARLPRSRPRIGPVA